MQASFLRDIGTSRISYQRWMLCNCRFYIQRINLKWKSLSSDWYFIDTAFLLAPISLSLSLFAIWSLLAFSVAMCLPLRKTAPVLRNCQVVLIQQKKAWGYELTQTHQGETETIIFRGCFIFLMNCQKEDSLRWYATVK